jgi:mono/diheme cytochrome c family protein
MKLPGIAIGAVAAIGLGAGAYAFLHSRLEARRGAEQWQSLKTYCSDCHNAAEAAGNVVFEGVGPDAIAAKPEIFEAAIRKLRGGLMPPPGNPRPDQKHIEEFVRFAETSIDRNAREPRAGYTSVQRLNRTEYAASVKDLLGVEIDAKQYLPTEIEVDGFDNIAAALSVSPAFLEQYLGVARKVARLAIGEPTPKLASVYFAPPGGDQDGYTDGLPPGTRGGTRFTHPFPADGEYRLTISDLDVGLYPRSLETEQTVVVLLDRDEVYRAKLGGREDLALVDHGGAPARAEIMQRFAAIPLHVTAGVHEIVVTFVERSRAATDEAIFGFTPYGGFSYQGQMRVPRLIGGVELKGPYTPTGVSRTASRDKVFVCTPAAASEERACAQMIAATLARHAFRRPVGADDVARLMPFYETGRKSGSFDSGIEQLVTAVLASPDFLYRAIDPPAATHPATFALDDFALASRLSFFLWNQGPDDALLALAERGALHDTPALDAQVDRMLADPRAKTLVTSFALKWLNVDDLTAVVPDAQIFPEFSDALRTDFAAEIESFLASVLLDNHDVRDLLTSDQTFLDERLARHYGIGGVHGPQFRRVKLDDPARFGLLGKGAVLLRTSYGDRTSPVLRGAWVLDKLMGTPPTPPPPNVVVDLTQKAGEKPKTLRARLERHRTDAVCSGCHSVIDPYGLALENFTVTGQWRTVDREAGEQIDAQSTLVTGVPVNGPVALRNALLARPDQFVQAVTEKLMMYALGRKLAYHDMTQVRAIVHDAATHDYRFAELVHGIVRSDAFREQAPPREPSGGAQTVARADAR